MLRKKWNKLVLILLALPLLLFCNAYALDDAGVAISGSFYSYDYHILQGSSIESPSINIVLFNNNSDEIRIKLNVDAPEGIEIITEDGLVSIRPNQKITIPVSIHAMSSLAPGVYDISITCQQQKIKLTDTLNVSSMVSLDSTVTVYSEASFVELTTTNKINVPIESEIFVNRVNENYEVSPVMYSTNGVITGNIPPGSYEITAFIDNSLIHKSIINLENGQNVSESLKCDLIDIANLTARKAYNNDAGKLEAVEVSFAMSNLLTSISDVRLSMNVYKDNELFESVDMFRINELIPGTNDFVYRYTPQLGWSNGEYDFEVLVKRDIFDESRTIVVSSNTIDISDETTLNITRAKSVEDYLQQIIPFVIIAFLLLCIFLMIVLLTRRIQMRDSFVPLPISDILDDIFAKRALMYDDEYEMLESAEETTEPQPDENIKEVNSPHNDEEEQLTRESVINIVAEYYITLPKTHLCPICGGSGATLYNGITEECVYCNGLGKVMNGMRLDQEHLTECVKCAGLGYIEDEFGVETCSFCNGYKQTVTGKGAIYRNKRKLKVNNINYELIEREVSKYLFENGIELPSENPILLNQ